MEMQTFQKPIHTQLEKQLIIDANATRPHKNIVPWRKFYQSSVSAIVIFTPRITIFVQFIILSILDIGCGKVNLQKCMKAN